MKTINDSILQDSDAIYTAQLDGHGGVIEITADTIATNDNPYWIHLDYRKPQSAKWIEETEALPPIAKDVLLAENIRPKAQRIGEGVVINLQTINNNPNDRPDELVAFRIYINSQTIVSSRHRRVNSVDSVIHTLELGSGPESSGDWLITMADAVTDEIGEFVETLHDQLIELEDMILDQQIPARGELALLRKQLIVLRRYMAPQRDVFSRLSIEKLPWMSDSDRVTMLEISERLSRRLEDLDSSISRTAVIADEITSMMADAMNRRTYTMSLMAMLFLPTTFLTGLFGVNLGGIPGNEFPYGFAIFCLSLFVLIVIVTWWLKRSRWL
ncbi:zinc transporter ZntB [Proteus vulgaris]|uniref:zinc transporter ZntB n=1 Tax=Proteus TaxID=583 RepID=UPI000D685BEE|nr:MULTISPECIES: zinc transporter ZntB [Proteus]MBQ0215324.1 zinc transporter ZntB [Proteus vulgaris]MDS0790276.1 zinc transporter ZntB [Proteus vulgaris]NBM56833.1 zinc transporter ZntB [Proteus sp. G2669]UDN37749.1 zinc transporter ZntB [Proteus sp. NMG38-2]UPK82940.1 zinc transporter ZntB [Proteus vulgaris]